MNTATGSDDPRDYLVAQGFETYAPEDHATWRTLARRQREILKGRIADPFLDGLDRLGIGEAGIPDFRVLNRTLKAATGWEVVAVPGPDPGPRLLPPARRPQVPGGFWIRKPSRSTTSRSPTSSTTCSGTCR
jgi:phenylalanine-4-hydroxylase